MNINILSQDGKILVNYNNVASLSIKQEHMQCSTPPVWWEIRAMYPAVSMDILYDTLARFDTEEECEKAFTELMHEIYLQNTIVKL